MTIISPLHGYLVNPGHLDEVVAPCYDSMTQQEKITYIECHQKSFVNAMRMLNDYPDNQRPNRKELLERNARHLQHLIDAEFFLPLCQPSMFIYRLQTKDHQQTGIVAEIPISEYKQGRIKIHERTRKNKEKHLSEYLERVSLKSAPISVTYPHSAGIDQLTTKLIAENPPKLHFTSNDGVTQMVWEIIDSDIQSKLASLFAEIPHLYLTDGHHRASATARIAKQGSHPKGKNSSQHSLLVTLFPDNQMRILPFHRCVRDLNGHTLAEFLHRLEEIFTIEEIAINSAAPPARHGEFLLLTQTGNYRLHSTIRIESIPDPLHKLDVCFLEDRVLRPLLGINKSGNDKRLEYVAGTNGIQGIQTFLQERDWQLGFACCPTSIEELFAIADANQIMPPKSTCFDPKTRAGIFLTTS